MPWDELQYQQRAVSILKRVIENGRIAHAYLFTGPEGVGKMKAARLFAQALNCEKRSGDPCGICKSCDMIERSMDIENVVHPDLLHLVPGRWTGDDGRRQASHTILINAVRELCSRLYNAPLMASRRIVIVHEADTMQLAAQNSFLKTLEEPLEKLRTNFILVSSRPHALLNTIHSRCQKVSFGFVPPETIVEELRAEFEIGESPAELLASLADGSLGRAMALAGHGADENTLSISERDKWLDQFHETVAVSKGDYEPLLRELGTSRQNAARFLKLLISWHRDLLLVKANGDMEKIIHRDRLEHLKEQAENVHVKEITRRMDRFLDIEGELKTIFIRADLAMESLFLEMTRG